MPGARASTTPVSRRASTASRSARSTPRATSTSSPATATWTVDTIAPDTAIESGPDALTNSRSASFTYSGGDRYECKLDDGAWAACRDTYADLADGEHRLQARAVDAAGNTDDTPGSHTWTVDTVAPETTIDSGPDALTSSRSASFTYSGGDRYECRLDDGDWAACRDTYADLADGEHRLQARAVDAAGNPDDSPASHSWTVDTVAPETTIDSGPDAVTASRSASFTYGGGTSYECRLDDAAWAACPAGYSGPRRRRAPVPGPRHATPPATPTTARPSTRGRST